MVPIFFDFSCYLAEVLIKMAIFLPPSKNSPLTPLTILAFQHIIRLPNKLVT